MAPAKARVSTWLLMPATTNASPSVSLLHTDSGGFIMMCSQIDMVVTFEAYM